MIDSVGWVLAPYRSTWLIPEISVLSRPCKAIHESMTRQRGGHQLSQSCYVGRLILRLNPVFCGFGWQFRRLFWFIELGTLLVVLFQTPFCSSMKRIAWLYSFEVDRCSVSGLNFLLFAGSPCAIVKLILLYVRYTRKRTDVAEKSPPVQRLMPRIR